ncbi:MAG: sigma-54-dependent Fis family transcriptional regulator [Bacteroidetes bacterium]|nr:sigma-54-dependent Fis family transcriptional regulator [Bacteroidota bacterium]MCW5897472.1 sigma-54-dependent Fis family transcriptional regulator [Bacteroidota bacterium]
MDTLLLVDRDKSFQERAASYWGTHFSVICADSINPALEALTTRKIDVVLIEISFLTGDVNLITRIKKEFDPHLPVIVLCEQGNLDQAITAMRSGAYDFTLKGLNPELLFEKIAGALRFRESEMHLQLLHTNAAEKHDRFVFASDAMKKIHFEITRLAEQNFDVLLCGETGVGKDLLAFELHRRSSRAAKPFITLPMRSLSETLIESELFGHEKGAFSGADSMKIGKLEAANQGTLYIPEISTLTELLQLKLLHFLQYKTITRVGQDSRKPEIPLDVRLVFATNKRLEDEVERGHVREDFYYRISGVTIMIPPLRERVDDIEPLFRYFLGKYTPLTTALPFSIADELLDALRHYRWPGNVREIENCVKQILAKSSNNMLNISNLPFSVESAEAGETCRVCLGTKFANFTKYSQAETQFKRAYFSVLMEHVGNNISLAAKAAGMTPQGLRKALKTLTLDRH